MDRGLVGLAVAAGMVAALNPCGFAMLPAYLLLVVRGAGTRASGVAAAGRALAATAGMAFRFLGAAAARAGGGAVRPRVAAERAAGRTSYRIQPQRRPHRSRINTTRTSVANPIRDQFSMWPTWLPRSMASSSPKMIRPTTC